MELKSGYAKFYGMATIIEEPIAPWYDENISITYLKFDDGYIVLTEDPDDGYRSHGELSFTKKCPEDLVFNLEASPCEVYRDFDTKDLREDDQRWARSWDGLVLRFTPEGNVFGHFGTDNSDDYYPCYQCELDIKLMNELYYQSTPLYKVLNSGE